MDTPYDDIDWADLEACETNASDIPVLLSKLAHGDSQERENAIGRLFWRLYNQGTVYEATAKAIPYLFDALENSTQEEPALAELVAAVASGSGFMEKHQHLPEFMLKNLREFHAAYGRTLEQVVESEMKYVSVIRDYSNRRLDLLFKYIDVDHAGCRASVAKCLGHFPQWHAEATQILRRRSTIESDGNVREAIAEATNRITTG